MKLTSPAFEAGGTLPRRFTCDGTDVSPPLCWEAVPEGTRSFALIMDDPDAPAGSWVHWVVYDLRGEMRALDEGLPKQERPGPGVKQGRSWGVGRYSRVGYHGPCPPPGAPHRYYFHLYALDTMLSLSAEATREAVAQALRGHVLAEAELMTLYGR